MFFPRKLPIEVWNCGVDFKNQINAGDTITSGNAVLSSGSVAVANPSVTGTIVTFQVSGGTTGSLCEVIVSCATSSGETLAEPALFQIIG